MNHHLLYNVSCLENIHSFQAEVKHLQHSLRISGVLRPGHLAKNDFLP